ncbi:hypothetical protein CRUP_032798 [Coryphaenoides rupestris]|nr:hypothetical protein CRUP_032798 [Coryphaenoides rupestris]
MVLHYSLLHPKSTEISQGLHHSSSNMGSVCLEPGASFFSLGDKNLPLPSVPHHGTFSLARAAGSLAEHPGPCGARASSACPCYHHHWLLIRLALKTGDLGKINRAYGAGGAAVILDMEEYNQGFKSDDGTITAGGGGGSCDLVSASDSLGKGMAPLSDSKEEFQSVSEPTSVSSEEEEEQEEEDDERSSPEGKSVFGDSPEHYYCPTESSSTLYYSADHQSPSSTSNLRLDGGGGGGPQQGFRRLASIPSDSALNRDVQEPAGRLGPCYTSAPKLDSGSQDTPDIVPYLTGPRSQLIRSRRDEEERF